MLRAQSQPSARKAARFLAMTAGTAVSGAGFGVLAAFVTGYILRGSALGLAGLGVVALMMLAGYLVGVIIGIIATDKVIHYRGSVWLGILGSILGMALTAGLAEPLRLNSNPYLLFGSIMAAIPLLGTLGFHLRGKKAGGRSLVRTSGAGADGGDGRIRTAE